jgi:uncharacterized repeat protein (TIGR01451 family)
MQTLYRTKLTVSLFLLGLVVLIRSAFPQPISAAGMWYVATTGNDANTCSAVATPCASINGALAKPGFVAGDTVRVAVGTYTGTGSEVVLINKGVTLSGGWDATFTTQIGKSTIDGQITRNGVTTDYVTAIIDKFIIQNAFDNTFGGDGITARGFLTLTNSIVQNNQHRGMQLTSIYSVYVINNSIIANNQADGIYGAGTITVTNTTISGNGLSGFTFVVGNSYVNGTTISGNGYNGLYDVYATINLENSTISGNNFGGIVNNSGAVFINSSTVFGNSGPDGQIRDGIFGSASIRNSIVFGNTPSDCGGSITSLGYNIVGVLTECTWNLAGGDQIGVDPLVGPLQDNGGPTFTHALLASSPAINLGNPTGCVGSTGILTADQRGRPRFGRCDIGAYEEQSLTALSVEKRIDKPITFRGDLLTWQIILNNYGAVGINNIIVTDTLPTNLTYANNSLTATGGNANINNGVVTWNGSVSANTAVTIAFGTRVSNSAPIGTTIINSANINNGGSVVARTAATVVQNRFAASSKYTDASTISYGYPLYYTIDFQLSGAAPAPSVRVTDTLPSSLSYIPNSLVASSGTPNYSNGVITWNGAVNSSQSVSITFGTMVNPSVPIGNSIVNSAIISGDGEMITATAGAVNVVSRFDSATKSVDKSTVTPGDSATYTINFKLSDVTSATTVWVTDTLPNNFTYTNGSLSATSGNYNYSNGTVYWNGPVNPGGTVVINFGVRVNNSTPATTIVNSALINAGGEVVTRATSMAVSVPSLTFIPTINKSYAVARLYGNVSQSYAMSAMVALELRFYNGSTWSTLQTTSSNSNGDYQFFVPTLGPGQMYYVRYLNSSDYTRLSYWRTRVLTSFTGLSDVAIGDFNVANISLNSPPPGLLVSLPTMFQWGTRPGMSSDSYEFNLIDYTDGNPWWWTPPLGNVNSYTLNSLPFGFNTNTPYGWYVGVYSPDGGYGESFYINVIGFSNTGNAPRPSAPARVRPMLEDPPRPKVAPNR